LLLAAGAAHHPDDLEIELRSRPDLRLVCTRDLAAAESALRSNRVAIAVVGPDAPTRWVDGLAAAIGRSSPGIPVLAVRHPGAEQPARWREAGIGVLRSPLVPFTLSRSVDVVLGLVSKGVES
jgi:hypothetical protein